MFCCIKVASYFPAYHEKCIDPWLTKNKRSCPICKRKVIPGDRSDSDSETDSEAENGNGRNSENTPLLSGGNNTTRPRGGNTFESSGQNPLYTLSGQKAFIVEKRLS